MKIFLKSFTDGLLQLLEEFGATPVSVEIAEDRLVKKIELDEELPLVKIDSYKELFAKHDAVKFDYEFDKDNLCFACEVSPTDGKDEGIVVITDEKTAEETTDDKMIIPPTVERSDNPSDIALKLRALHAERIAQGLCAGCGKRPPETTLIEGRPSRYCRQCQMQKRNARDKKKLELLETTKEMPENEPTPFKQLEIAVDIKDARSKNDYWNERRARLASQGICVNCGKRKATPLKNGKSSKYCTYCRKRRARNKKARAYSKR